MHPTAEANSISKQKAVSRRLLRHTYKERRFFPTRSQEMPQMQLGGVVQHIRKLAGAASVRDLSDSQLLERFITGQDEAAFAALVQRHGRLVWSVCWQVL